MKNKNKIEDLDIIFETMPGLVIQIKDVGATLFLKERKSGKVLKAISEYPTMAKAKKDAERQISILVGELNCQI